MGGFKEGTVNGWDDEEDDVSDSGTAFEPDEAAADDTSLDAASVDADGDIDVDTAATSSTASSDIPWLLRRNSITDGREQTVQLHLQEETLRVQRTEKSVIEGRLGESVRKADLREAALLVGLQQTDDVIKVLKQWGYDLD